MCALAASSARTRTHCLSPSCPQPCLPPQPHALALPPSPPPPASLSGRAGSLCCCACGTRYAVPPSRRPQAKVEQLPEGLQGRTFGAARHLYRDAVVAGMLRNGALNTNCDAMVLGPGDQLVLFTHAGGWVRGWAGALRQGNGGWGGCVLLIHAPRAADAWVGGWVGEWVGRLVGR